MNKWVAAALCAGAFALPLGTARADDDWTVRTTFYGWLTSMTGSSNVRGNHIDIDANFGDMASELDSIVALMSYTEARKEHWGFYLDMVYADIGFTAESAKLRTPLPGLSFSRELDAGLGTKLVIVEGGGFYELTRWGDSAAAYTALEATGGARYMQASADLSLAITGTVDLPLGFSREGEFAVARTGTIDWVDPFVGLRLRHVFAEGDRIALRGDVGGFGVGSEFAWQLLLTYSHNFTIGETPLSVALGYRAIGFKHESGRGPSAFDLDMTIHGPLVGLTFRW